MVNECDKTDSDAEAPCPNVLIVSQDAELVRQCLEVLAEAGVRGVVLRDGRSVRQRFAGCPWDLLLLDLQGGKEGALRLAEDLRRDWPELPAILFQACEGGPAADRPHGCQEFLCKPVQASSLRLAVQRFLPNHPVPLVSADREDSRCLHPIAGQSPLLTETIRLARKVAPTSLPVLITGESGTGKELISYLLHRCSNRWQGPYVRVNCAALSESLLESELFGHERGAFTGAFTRRIGKFELAHGGTLLLDEISETSPRLQAELLRVMEQQDFERVGGSESVRVNVRIIGTSNRDLQKEVQARRFRQDLYYRICGLHLRVAPLRERQEDITALVWHFVNLYSREARRRITELDPGMLKLFQGYPWPGNVRQLRNVVRTILVLGEGEVLSLAGAPMLEEELRRPPGAGEASADSLQLQDLERYAILEALRRTQRNQVKAARLLGITDRTLREKLRRYHQEGHLQPAGDNRW